MSLFLRALVRSEGKSCEGKLKYPREDSAVRNALAMTEKKKKLHAAEGRESTEFFETYKCNFCDGWHIGHQTNFDWIPQSHRAQHLMMNKYECFSKIDEVVCGKIWISNTVFSNRILEHFPNVKDEMERLVICPKCKGTLYKNHGRLWVNLETINPESTETIEALWAKQDVSVDNLAES
jgi:hypothetical protein